VWNELTCPKLGLTSHDFAVTAIHKINNVKLISDVKGNFRRPVVK